MLLIINDTLARSKNNATTPALVRYTADGGATWNTVGLDVVGGELVVDRSILPSGGVEFQVALGG